MRLASQQTGEPLIQQVQQLSAEIPVLYSHSLPLSMYQFASLYQSSASLSIANRSSALGRQIVLCFSMHKTGLSLKIESVTFVILVTAANFKQGNV